MERPLTVAGLLEKRAELTKARAQLAAELEAVTFDIEHLDAVIRLFDPEQVPVVRKRYMAQHSARGGEMARFVLSTLRTANAPMTARQIGLQWAADNGVDASETTARVLRKRVGSCLRNLAGKGHVAEAGAVEDAKGWLLS
ncbi:MAG: hypothetical protein WDN45_12770 [Caulobacteraceae bacterium]